MSDNDDIRHGRHCVFKMHVHWVFVAKYRRRVFDGDPIELLRNIFAKTCADSEAQLIEMDGEEDHVHLLRKERPNIQKPYRKGLLWSPPYLTPDSP